MNILIPCAGQAKRFQEAGFTDLKPFIETQGKPMISWVVDNFKSECYDTYFYFVFQDKHVYEYKIEDKLKEIFKDSSIEYEILRVSGLTDGSASTIHQQRNHIHPDEKLIIANSDQYVSNFDLDRWIGWACKDDASILTFNDTDSKWSFVEPKDEIYAANVVEKQPVSNIANVGMFYYKEARDAFWAIDEMKSKKIKVGNEFYLAPSMNELIEDDAKVSYKVLEPYQKMWGLGTPFDHQNFEKKYKHVIQ